MGEREEGKGGIPSSNLSSAHLPVRRGRSPLGVSFERAKETKTRLGRSPLSTPLGVRGWACVKAIFGPLVLLGPLFVPPHQAALGSWPYSWVISMSGPTMEKRRSRRRKHGLTPCGAVVGAVACPARGYPGIAPGDSGGASPSPTTGHRESGQSKGLHSSFFIHHYSFDSSPSAQGWPPGPRTRCRPGGYSAGPASPRRPRWWGACR